MKLTKLVAMTVALVVPAGGLAGGAEQKLEGKTIELLAADTDDDGKATKRELSVWAEEHLGEAAECRELLKRYDTDRDGAIEAKELHERQVIGAEMTMMALVQAIDAYQFDYGKLPEIGETANGSALKTGSALMNILLGSDEGNNPRQVQFFAGRQALGKPGQAGFDGLSFSRSEAKEPLVSLLDPWGNPYRVLLDPNADNALSDPFTGKLLVNTSAVVWSAGPDGKLDYENAEALVNQDNVYSWK